jgi:hypothetical protein
MTEPDREEVDVAAARDVHVACPHGRPISTPVPFETSPHVTDQ